MPKQANDQPATTDAPKVTYYVPEFGISVEAPSLEEAIKLAQKEQKNG